MSTKMMASYYNEARKHEKKLRKLQRDVSKKQCRAHDAALLLRTKPHFSLFVDGHSFPILHDQKLHYEMEVKQPHMFQRDSGDPSLEKVFLDRFDIRMLIDPGSSLERVLSNTNIPTSSREPSFTCDATEQDQPQLLAALQFERYRPLVEAIRFNIDQVAHVTAAANGVDDNLKLLMYEAKERIAKEAKKDNRVTQFDHIGEDALSDDYNSEEEIDNEGALTFFELPAWTKTATSAPLGSAGQAALAPTFNDATILQLNSTSKTAQHLPEGGQLAASTMSSDKVSWTAFTSYRIPLYHKFVQLEAIQQQANRYMKSENELLLTEKSAGGSRSDQRRALQQSREVDAVLQIFNHDTLEYYKSILSQHVKLFKRKTPLSAIEYTEMTKDDEVEQPKCATLSISMPLRQLFPLKTLSLFFPSALIRWVSTDTSRRRSTKKSSDGTKESRSKLDLSGIVIGGSLDDGLMDGIPVPSVTQTRQISRRVPERNYSSSRRSDDDMKSDKGINRWRRRGSRSPSRSTSEPRSSRRSWHDRHSHKQGRVSKRRSPSGHSLSKRRHRRCRSRSRSRSSGYRSDSRDQRSKPLYRERSKSPSPRRSHVERRVCREYGAEVAEKTHSMPTPSGPELLKLKMRALMNRTIKRDNEMANG